MDERIARIRAQIRSGQYENPLRISVTVDKVQQALAKSEHTIIMKGQDTMCGVFGYIGQEGQKPNLQRLQKIAQATESRGRHAFGFAWIDSRGRLRCYKQTGKISDHLGLLNMAADARMIIGHCRYATQGDPANNLNNHPHACDGGWIVHNGMIPDHEDIFAERDWPQVTDCDSEVLALYIEEGRGTLPARCAAAAAIDAPTVLLGLWSRPGMLIAARSGNPLHVGRVKHGVYLGSLSDELPGEVKSVANESMIVFTRSGGEIHEQKGKISAGAGETGLRAGELHGVCPLSGYAQPARVAKEVRRGCCFD